MYHNIVVINPGSTSDDIGFFSGERMLFSKTSRYRPDDLKAYEGKKVTAQYEMRRDMLLSALKEQGVDIKTIHAAIGRGGLLKPIPGGTYRVNAAMLADLRQGLMGDHPSNLGGLLAHELAQLSGAQAFIADPVVVDELEPLARYSGMPENPRISIFHALNQKRVARLAAEKLKKKYERCRLIVMHGGGGISVGAHKDGRVVDVNNALDGDGPFTPQRSGGVPSGGLAAMCFSGKYSRSDIKLKLKGRGGLVAYTGTSDLVALENYVKTGAAPEGSGINQTALPPEKARECVVAMAYQIAKEIAAMSTVLEGKVDAIVLTGGIAYDELVISEIRRRVEWIAPIIMFPGGDEKRALRDAAARALNNPETVKDYV